MRQYERYGGPPLTESEFNALADQWEDETRHQSIFFHKSKHPAYQEITQKGGRSLLQYILRRMQRKPGLWFSLLFVLTNAKPVPDELRGNITAMTDKWLEWANEHHLIEASTA